MFMFSEIFWSIMLVVAPINFWAQTYRIKIWHTNNLPLAGSTPGRSRWRCFRHTRTKKAGWGTDWTACWCKSELDLWRCNFIWYLCERLWAAVYWGMFYGNFQIHLKIGIFHSSTAEIKSRGLSEKYRERIRDSCIAYILYILQWKIQGV